jgi:hypothetical protein
LGKVGAQSAAYRAIVSFQDNTPSSPFAARFGPPTLVNEDPADAACGQRRELSRIVWHTGGYLDRFRVPAGGLGRAMSCLPWFKAAA